MHTYHRTNLISTYSNHTTIEHHRTERGWECNPQGTRVLEMATPMPPADLEISAHLVEMYSLCLSLLAGNYMHQNWGRNPPKKKMTKNGAGRGIYHPTLKSLWEECFPKSLGRMLSFRLRAKWKVGNRRCCLWQWQLPKKYFTESEHLLQGVVHTFDAILLQLEEKAGRHLRIGRASIEKCRTGMCEELPGTAFGRGFFKKIHLIQVAAFILPTSWNFEKIQTHHTMDPYIQHQAIPQLTLDVATWTSSHRFPGRLSHPHNGYHRPRASKGAVAVPRFCRAHVEDTTSPRSWNQSSHSLDPQTERVQTWKMIIRCIKFKYTKR